MIRGCLILYVDDDIGRIWGVLSRCYIMNSGCLEHVTKKSIKYPPSKNFMVEVHHLVIATKGFFL